MSKAFVGKPAPAFSALAFDKGIKKISNTDYAGKWVVLFFYPFDFTFVCPTEIINFSEAAKIFRENNCEVLGCSIDSAFVHSEWTKKPRREGGLGSMDIPLLADVDKKIAQDFGVLIDDGPNKGATWRGTFIIDDKGIIRHLSINDLPVGRNIDEVLRLVQGFQHSDKFGEVCPAKWKPGAKTMKADHSAA